MRVRRLVMLRHGQTEYNAGSRMQGQLDTDLSELGREQAAGAAEVLAKRQPLVVISSDLPEVMGLSHRMALYRGGRIVREVLAKDTRADEVMAELTRH